MRLEVIHGDQSGGDEAAEASTSIGRRPQIALNNLPSFMT